MPNKEVQELKDKVARLTDAVKRARQFGRAIQPDQPGPMAQQIGNFCKEMDAVLNNEPDPRKDSFYNILERACSILRGYTSNKVFLLSFIDNLRSVLARKHYAQAKYFNVDDEINFEGSVLAVDNNVSFPAHIIDGENEFEIEIDFRDLDEHDIPYVVPGAIFYMRAKGRHGNPLTKIPDYEITFSREVWTKEEIDKAKARAEEVKSILGM